ncbi:unnamed protein product [Rotaria sp. Silwood1]|nr:unnamed protein product [Rotaria sp. Silwood1]CAF3874411.1 unnamed protein product [Rotaria sp. Silwood1]CAF3980596.1 unnamed protein product [Rotaria sp. Silwood1]CAF4745251.1 unnamed protein product [Rotaria sp. Silwood1]
MSETFNLRSFFENQMEKLSTPTNTLMDKVRQTVDNMKFTFTSINNTEQDTSIILPTNDVLFNLFSSESLSSSSVSSNSSNLHLSGSRLHSPNIQKSIENTKYLTDRISSRQSILRRHVSESNKSDDTRLSPIIYHNNPTINIQGLLNNDNNLREEMINRSRSLIRQSTDTTSTFPIRRSIRRMESIEIPGLNGVKAIRYINDNLGKLEPNLYKKPIQLNDPSYNSGSITLTLFYNQSLTSLIITIISIDHLPFRDLNSKVLPNPFVKLCLLPDRRKKFQTKVYKHIESVQFNETFEFQTTYKQLYKRILLLSVYDFRRSSKRNLIGTVKIDDICLKSDITSQTITLTKHIVPGTESDPDLGELTVSLCCLPNAKRITVTIVKANSLKPMDITGKSDPYVKVVLLINGKKIRKKKTSVVSNTLNPIYNESLEFDLSNEEFENTDLIFKVIDYDRVGSNELIGCIGIGCHFDGINRDHWYQMIEHPHVPITQNYSLRETVPIITCTNSKTIQQTK